MAFPDSSAPKEASRPPPLFAYLAASTMSDSPWNVAPVAGQEPPKPAAPASKPKKEKKPKEEEHVVWNAAPKPDAGLAEKTKDKARSAVEDLKDKAAHVTSNIEGYTKDSVLKAKIKKEEFDQKRKEAKHDKKEGKKEADSGACGLCGCTIQ